MKYSSNKKMAYIFGAAEGLGIALVSQLLAEQKTAAGLLVPLAEQTVRGADWAWLVHRDSENDPLTRQFCEWLAGSLPGAVERHN